MVTMLMMMMMALEVDPDESSGFEAMDVSVSINLDRSQANVDYTSLNSSCSISKGRILILVVRQIRPPTKITVKKRIHLKMYPVLSTSLGPIR